MLLLFNDLTCDACIYIIYDEIRYSVSVKYCHIIFLNPAHPWREHFLGYWFSVSDVTSHGAHFLFAILRMKKRPFLGPTQLQYLLLQMCLGCTHVIIQIET